MRFGGIDLTLGGLNLSGTADGAQGFKMALSGVELTLGLDQSDLGIVSKLLGESAFFDQCYTVVVNLFRGVQSLVGTINIGLGLGHIFRKRPCRNGLVLRFGLGVERLAFRSSGDEIAVFELSNQLTL